jgi:uncharacterized protein YyaL (SSP411 family)
MSAPLSNRLSGETSPYLLQHADNPVAWQPWDAAALETARREDRPILLSIGYSACHWCHVMAHESFENAEVAAVMNRLFVNIKVDREERPDLDQIYQTAHQMLTSRAGGWPLTMFLSPEGTPFFGGTYFPLTPRYGLPGFADLLERIAGLWRDRRAEIEQQNVSLRDAMASQRPDGDDFALPGEETIAAARLRLLEGVDGHYGGFGDAPKFPHPTDLAFLLRRARADDLPSREALLLTLERMAAGGIFDQLGGGFCRYSVDARWEIPHFEKMLYDNGLLLGLYADAWQLTKVPRLATVVDATAGWLMREMQLDAGGYCSSLDADSEGEEGRFYYWDREEVRRALDPDEWAVAQRCWGLDRAANFEGLHWHVTLAAVPEGAEEAARLESARRKLFDLRERRIRPGRDDKVLTAWNALAIAGMLRAGRLLARQDWRDSARRALDFVRSTLWVDGRLLATCRNGRAHLPAYLDDHAFLLAALLESLRCDFRAQDLDFAVALAELLLDHFADPDVGGFFFTAHDHEALIHRPKPAFDNATPAGNGVAATALQRLGYLLGETRYIDAAQRTLRLFSPQMTRQPTGCAALLEALQESLTPPTSIILRGPAAAVTQWQERMAGADAFVIGLPNGLQGLPPALAKPEADRVNAWVCSGVTCHAPVNDYDELSRINPVRN